MATDSALRSVSNTLSGTTADTVTLLQSWSAIEVTNADSTNDVWVRQDGTAAVALADNCTRVPAGTTKMIRASVNGTGNGQIAVSIVGNGGAYSIEGVA